MKLISSLVLTFSIIFSFSGQSQTTGPSEVKGSSANVAKTGMLTGFAFLITKGGDIKPARLANVTLFFDAPRQLGPEEEYPSTTVGGQWVRNRIKLASEAIAQLKYQTTTKNTLPEEVDCLSELKNFQTKLKDTLYWAEANKKQGQVVSADVDEEGRFKISHLRPGQYGVVVAGRAGIYEAWWQSTVLLTADKTTSIKLPKPETACEAIN